jgi:hypothetical protein
MHPKFAPLLAFVLAALPAPPAAAQNQPTVEGTIAYDAATIPMTYVSARETRPLPDRDDPPQVVILIADRPAPPDIAGSRQAYYRAAREGRIRGLLISLEPPDETRLAIFAPGGGSADVALPDPFSRIELTDFRREGAWVSGHVRTIEPGEFDGGEGRAGEPTHYAIDLRFRVPVAPAPVPSEMLTGEAARRSPQAAAALRGLELIRTGTPEQIRSALDPDHPAWAGLGGAQAAAILAAMRRGMPSPATLLQSIERVAIYGDEAIVVERNGGDTIRIFLRRDAGIWKLAAAPIPND